MNLSPELERLLRHVAGDPERQPACLDDAVEALDELDNFELAVLCLVSTGPRVESHFVSLSSSCALRQRLEDELAELELAEVGEGWIESILQQEEATA